MKNKIIIGIFLLVGIFVSACSQGVVNDVTGDVVYVEDFIQILVSDISSQVQHYSYNVNGKEVNYFVVKGSDGEIRTAFDACDICGGSKGYRQEGNDMVCNNCERAFNIDSIGTANMGGGCWPSYLTHEIKGEYILISKSELEQGAFRF